MRTDVLYSSLHGWEVSVIQLPDKRGKQVQYTPMELYNVRIERDLGILISYCYITNHPKPQWLKTFIFAHVCRLAGLT